MQRFRHVERHERERRRALRDSPHTRVFIKVANTRPSIRAENAVVVELLVLNSRSILGAANAGGDGPVLGPRLPSRSDGVADPHIQRFAKPPVGIDADQEVRHDVEPDEGAVEACQRVDKGPDRRNMGRVPHAFRRQTDAEQGPRRNRHRLRRARLPLVDSRRRSRNGRWPVRRRRRLAGLAESPIPARRFMPLPAP